MKKKLFSVCAAMLSLSFMLSGCGEKCAFDGCENEASSRLGYCRDHTCTIDKCYQPTINNGPYCAEHGCNAYGCINEGRNECDYCKEHSCTYFFCKNVRIAGEIFCEEHISRKCKMNGCHDRAGDNGYCTEHTCKVLGCDSPVLDGKGTCEEHLKYACQWDGCSDTTCYYDWSKADLLSGHGNKNYCYTHGCRYGDCKDAAQSGGLYCENHQKAVKEDEKKAEEEEKAKYKDKEIISEDGKYVWQVYAASDSLHFTATCKGSGYFGIKILDSNQDFFDLVLNERGSYELDKTIRGLTVGEKYYIQVELTDGTISYSWTGTYGK